jgi:hypothetical protein
MLHNDYHHKYSVQKNADRLVSPKGLGAKMNYSVSDRNEYQESSWGFKGRQARKADNLTAI